MKILAPAASPCTLAGFRKNMHVEKGSAESTCKVPTSHAYYAMDKTETENQNIRLKLFLTRVCASSEQTDVVTIP